MIHLEVVRTYETDVRERVNNAQEMDAFFNTIVVEKLRKSAHFILVDSTCKEVYVASIFMKEIFRLHGMPKEIIYDRNTKFTSSFWKSLMASFETKLLFSTTYHPQTDGKTKR